MKINRLIAGGILAFIFLAVFVYLASGVKLVLRNVFPEEGRDNLTASIADSAKSAAPAVIDKKELQVQASAAISIKTNLQDPPQIIFEKSADLQLPIASLTKLMTAIIVSDNYDLAKTLVVSEQADKQSAVKPDVNLGDAMPVESFLEITLIKSSNKAAYTLAENMGVEKFVGLMNQKAKEVGMLKTVFTDPTGLNPTNVSTVMDLAKLAEYILKNYPRLANISRAKEFFVPGFGKIENTDQLLAEVPEIVCGKTGFTEEAKGCLLLAISDQKDNGYFINVILGADDRFLEMKKIINVLQDNLQCEL